jgi:putative two-component system response regulator
MTMTLPAATATADPYLDDACDHAPIGLPLDEARILIVDDDAHAARLMRRVLEKDGFRSIMIVTDGRRAVDIALEHRPDVIVLDAHMPYLDGFAVLRELQDRDESVGRAIGVLGVSGDASPETCQAMLWGGADDFIVRPFDRTEFTLRVRRLVRATRELRCVVIYANWLETRMLDDVPDGRATRLAQPLGDG